LLDSKFVVKGRQFTKNLESLTLFERFLKKPKKQAFYIIRGYLYHSSSYFISFALAILMKSSRFDK